MEVIILAGGFGTRLQSVVKDVPKPMADINGKPFLFYLLSYVKQFDVHSIVLSVGYKQESIKSYFQNSFQGISLSYSSEDEPLGTGGALKKALEQTDEEYVLILNGDTFFNINLDRLFQAKTKDVTIAVQEMKESDRYGTLDIDAIGNIRAFREKQWMQQGYINGGIYKIHRYLFSKIKSTSFSFETFLTEHIHALNVDSYYEPDAYFIDIGIPKEYAKAQKDFKELF